MTTSLKTSLNIAVIGSRDFDNYELLEEALDNLISQLREKGHACVALVSGGAPGADSLAEYYAATKNIPITVHEADWNDVSHPDANVRINRFGKKYDANAGKRRNTKIIEDAHIVVAFHHDTPGTRDSLAKARASGKQIVEYRYE